LYYYLVIEVHHAALLIGNHVPRVSTAACVAVKPWERVWRKQDSSKPRSGGKKGGNFENLGLYIDHRNLHSKSLLYFFRYGLSLILSLWLVSLSYPWVRSGWIIIINQPINAFFLKFDYFFGRGKPFYNPPFIKFRVEGIHPSPASYVTVFKSPCSWRENGETRE
jgi:hypothetical protein